MIKNFDLNGFSDPAMDEAMDMAQAMDDEADIFENMEEDDDDDD